MANARVFTLLEKHINPLLANIDKDRRPSSDPLIGAIDIKMADGVQTPESALIDIYAFTSEPAVMIGDRRYYESAPRHLKQGQVKAKYFTQEVRISEDELNRIETNGGVTNIIKDMVEEQMKTNNEYFINQVRSVLIKGLSSGDEADSDIIAALGAGTSGTISDPYDLNATPGTAKDLTGSVTLRGADQTLNNINQIMTEVIFGMTKVDADTGMVLPIGKLYMGCDPHTYNALRGTKDKLNSTTGQLADLTCLKDLEQNYDVTVISDYNFDTTVTGADGDTPILTFFADPKDSLRMYLVPSNAKEVWSDWREGEEVNSKTGRKTILYSRRKSFEIATYAIPYWIRASSGSDGAFYKKVFRVEVTLE